MPEAGAVLDQVGAIGVVPVVAVPDAETGVRLTRALTAGGLATVEVTLRTDAAVSAIAAVAREVPQTLLGAGTVVDPADVARVAEAGARYVVSPGFSAAVGAACADAGVTYLPGAETATEVQTCLAAGYTTLKFFPAATSGGLAAVRALAAPFARHGVRFVPTGGIRPAALSEYLRAPEVLAVGGSWLAPDADLRAGAWETIRQRAAAARAAADAARLAGGAA